MNSFDRKKKEEPSEYDIQASDFLKKTGATITSVYTGHRPYWDDEKEFRATYMVTITREGRPAMAFPFGQSMIESWSYTKRGEWAGFGKGKEVSFQDKGNNDRRVMHAKQSGNEVIFDARGYRYTLSKQEKAPSAYTIITCLTKHDPGTFQDFCDNFGYDTDSRKAETTYHAVMKGYSDLSKIFSMEELEEMAEIQ